MALTKNVLRTYILGDTEAHPVIAGGVIYEGAAVGDNGSGYARPLEAGDNFLGFCLAPIANTHKGCSDGSQIVTVKFNGAVQLPISALAIDHVGAEVYADDDGTFTLAEAFNTPIGRVRSFVRDGFGIVEFNAGHAPNPTSPRHGYSASVADRPSALLFGAGTWQTKTNTYASDGCNWTDTTIRAVSSSLAKPSKLAMDFADPTYVWGKTAVTATLDKTYQRYSNYTLKVDISNNTAQIRKAAGTPAFTADPVDQLLSIELYLPFIPTSGTGGMSLNVTLCAGTSYSANNLVFSFDSNYLKEGWNSLRMWYGDTNGASGTGTLAYGAVKAVGGTGISFANSIGYADITFNNMSGKSVYLDSVRLGAKVNPVLVMGFDATGAGSADNVMTSTVAPYFASKGMSLYFTTSYIYDLLYAGYPDDVRKYELYDTYGWDALGHTWNHGGTAPGGTATVTLSRTSNVVTATWGAAHSYTTGSKWYAKISGSGVTDMNGIFEFTATNSTHATYTAAGEDGAGSGTITYSTLLADVVGNGGDSTLSTQILTHEIADVAQIMRSVGFNRAAHIGAFPNNSCPDLTTLKAVCSAAGVSLFRGVRGGTVKMDQFGLTNPLNLGSVEWGSGTTATTTQYVLDKLAGAIGRGEHMWTFGHYVLDETDPVNIAHVNANLAYAPGQGGNPNPPAGGTAGSYGGWWYLGQIKRFMNEGVLPAVANGTLKVMRPSDWANYVGIR